MGTIMTFIVTVGGVLAFKYWLSNRRGMAVDLKNIDLKLSEEDTRQMRIVQEMIEKNPSAAAVAACGEAMISDFVRRLESSDQIIVAGSPVLDGAAGKRLLRKPRPELVADRLEGDYLILSVQSGDVSDGLRSKVRNVTTGEELSLTIPADTLTPEQIEQIKQGEWGKQPMRMQISITRAGNRITKATLIRAGLVPPEN